MRDILISTAVFVACLLVAFVSQLVAPSTLLPSATAAAPGAPETQAAAAVATAISSPAAAPAAVRQAVAAPLELDPNDPNPTLFAMAPDSSAPTTGDDALAQGASALGGTWKPPRSA